MRKLLFSSIIALLAFIGCATQQERAERRELVKREVADALAQKCLRIEITSMNTLRYGSRMVSSDFFLELRGDTLKSYLPYLGQVYQSPMTTPSQGLNFETTILALHESHPKTHLSQLEVDVKTSEDTYLYTIEVYDTGKAYIHVRSLHRDPVNFDGEVVRIDLSR